MTRTSVITLHIKDAVSKTFHISEHDIILHVGDNETPIDVPRKYRDTLIALAEIAREEADETTVFIDYSISGSVDNVGSVAQAIWEEMITG